MITISEEALEQIIDLMMSEGINPDNYNLRVGVKGGGCSGLSYLMDFDDTITENDEVYNLGAIKVVVEKKHLLYLFGSELTFSDGLNGKGFQWVNPNSSRTCGCGSSFSV